MFSSSPDRADVEDSASSDSISNGVERGSSHNAVPWAGIATPRSLFGEVTVEDFDDGAPRGGGRRRGAIPLSRDRCVVPDQASPSPARTSRRTYRLKALVFVKQRNPAALPIASVSGSSLSSTATGWLNRGRQRRTGTATSHRREDARTTPGRHGPGSTRGSGPHSPLPALRVTRIVNRVIERPRLRERHFIRHNPLVLLGRHINHPEHAPRARVRFRCPCRHRN